MHNEKCYIRSYYKGKSLFARTADRTIFCFFIALGAFFFSRAFRVRVNPAAFIGILAFMFSLYIGSIITSIRLRSFIPKKRYELMLNIIKRQILLENDARIRSMIEKASESFSNSKLEFFRKFSSIQVDDICDILRKYTLSELKNKELVIIVLSDTTSQAREFAERLDAVKVTFIPVENILDLLGYELSEDDIAAELETELKKKPPKRNRLSAGNILSSASKYYLLGAVLLAASMVMHFSLYMSAVGMLCLGTACIISTKEYAIRIKSLD